MSHNPNDTSLVVFLEQSIPVGNYSRLLLKSLEYKSTLEDCASIFINLLIFSTKNNPSFYRGKDKEEERGEGVEVQRLMDSKGKKVK